MDVSVTNGLEGVRQYFQGLPTAPTSKPQDYPHPINHNAPYMQNNWQHPAPQQQPQHLQNDRYNHQIVENKPPIQYNNHAPAATPQLPKHEMRPANHEMWKSNYGGMETPVTGTSTSTANYNQYNRNSYPTYQNAYPVMQNPYKERGYEQPQQHVIQQQMRVPMEMRGQQEMRAPQQELRPASSQEIRHEMRPPQPSQQNHEMRTFQDARAHEMRPSPHTQHTQHELRPSPHEMRPSPHEMRPSPHEMRPSPHAMQPSPHEMRPSPHEMRPSPHEIRQSPHAMQPSPHEMRSSSHEIRPSPHVMQSSPHEMRPSPHSSHEMRTKPQEIINTHQMRPPSHEMRPQSHEIRPPSLEMRPIMSERPQELRIPERRTDYRVPVQPQTENRVIQELRPQEYFPAIEKRPPSLEIRLSPQNAPEPKRYPEFRYPPMKPETKPTQSLPQQIRSISNEISQLSQEIIPLAAQQQTQIIETRTVQEIRTQRPQEIRLQERHPTLQRTENRYREEPKQPQLNSHELVRSQHHADMMKSSSTQEVIRYPNQYPTYNYPRPPNPKDTKVMTTSANYPGSLQSYNMHLENPKPPQTVYYERTDSVEITKISSVEKRVVTQRNATYPGSQTLPYHDMQASFNDIQGSKAKPRYEPPKVDYYYPNQPGYRPPAPTEAYPRYPKQEVPYYQKPTYQQYPQTTRSYQPNHSSTNDISISVVPAPQQYYPPTTYPKTIKTTVPPAVRYTAPTPVVKTRPTKWPQPHLAFKTTTTVQNFKQTPYEQTYITTMAGQSNYTPTASTSSAMQLPAKPKVVPKVRRESPLDLSVKTVKSSADSSDDVQTGYSQMYRARAPNTGVAPRVDFAPNFNTPQLQPPVVPLPTTAPTQYFNTPQPQYNNRTSYYQSHMKIPNRKGMDRKRVIPAEPEPTPPKVPCTVDNWRQSIDQQIEQRLQSYANSKLQEKLTNGHPVPSMGLPPQKLNETPPTDIYISRSNSYNKLNQLPMQTGTGADKRVLSILRNSLEIKEAQKRELEQKLREKDEVTIIPTPTVIQDNKFHIPRAVDSIKSEKDEIEIQITTSEAEKADLDGLAANLAARIRTKAELKQIDPSELQKILAQQSLEKANPPLLEKVPIPPPRRRLFSRTEEDHSSNRNSVRSSSETSVFDFPDSDSESEMPVLERQSLEDMRRDRESRKSISKPSSTTNLTTVDLDLVIKTEPMETSPTPPPDPFFTETCDKFLEQLRSGTPVRKRGRKPKKVIEPIKIEPEIEEPPLELESIPMETTPVEPVVVEKIEPEIKKQLLEVTIKVEKLDVPLPTVVKEEVSVVPAVVDVAEIKVEPVDEVVDEDSCDSDVPLIHVKKKVEVESDDEEDLKFTRRCEVKLGAKIKIESSSSSEDSESESEEKETKPTETVANRLRQRKCRSSEKKTDQTETPVPTPRAKDNKNRSKSLPQKKPFGDGSDFRPGWEEEVYRYKQSLRMPVQLINISRPSRISTSLPDLDPCPSPSTSSITDSSEFFSHRQSIIKNLFGSTIPDVEDSNSSFSTTAKIVDDFEDATSSSTSKVENNNSIVDVLAQRYVNVKNKRKKLTKTSTPKIIPKSSNPLELLPTPSLDEPNETSVKKRGKEIIKPKAEIESANLLGYFRKETVESFRDAFRTRNNQTIHEQFRPIVFKSRTRKETQVLKQRATIREVFGEERPASAPPIVSHPDEIKVKIEAEPKEETKENKKQTKPKVQVKKEITPSRAGLRSALILRGNRSVLRNKRHLIKPNKKRLVSKAKVDKKDEKKEEKKEDLKVELQPEIKMEDIIIKAEIDLDVPPPLPVKKKYKLKSMRRKFSSGFDYIRKKKKQVKKVDVKDEVDDVAPVKPKRTPVQRPMAESVQDIQREIKGWVLNKGIGETHLHRAARLGYTDVIAYCLETVSNPPSPRDNAGYTPLHEACSRGHLDIAKLLLLYGANVHESAQGGIRPLHEASENGFVEVIRLLLSYGADPLLATYSGHTPLSLATDPDAISVLENYIADIQGKDAPAWTFNGPCSCLDDLEESGYDPLDNAPDAEKIDNNVPLFLEVSEVTLPNYYTFKSEKHEHKWVLLQDLLLLLKVKSREALLRLVNPSTSLSHKNILKEMKMNDFLEDSYCSAMMSAGERINARASKIALIKYNDRVRELLDVEDYLMPSTKS